MNAKQMRVTNTAFLRARRRPTPPDWKPRAEHFGVVFEYIPEDIWRNLVPEQERFPQRSICAIIPHDEVQVLGGTG